MLRLIMAILLAGMTLHVSAYDTADSLASPQSVGLVLSGGGAKGIAHIGVIQALEDNDIPIDYITGTSMGAIVGSLYACGYTPEKMMDLIKSRGFAHWSSGKIDKQLTYYFLQDDPTPAMLTLNIGESDSTRWKSILPSSLINPLPMNFAFMELYAPYTAQCGGDFDRLFVPFRAVASDVRGKRKVVCADGSLGDAVRASMSFPLVFHPIKIDGVPMYDGGIYDNFPVDVMRDTFAPQIMIGVDVSASDADEDIPNMMSQLETMIMQHSDYRMPRDYGIKMRLHLDRFGLLDFDKAEEIYDIGYNYAMSMMDSIKSRIHVRVPAEARTLRREVFNSQTPYLRFDSVSVRGGNRRQNEYLEYLFTHHHSDTLDVGRAKDAFYRAITPGKLTNFEPQAVYNDSTRLFALNLDASVKNNISVGIGGYLTTSTTSMLFFSAGYKTLDFNSLDMQFNGWVGQSYLAASARAQIKLLRSVPSSLQIQAVASRQKYFQSDRLFFQTSERTFVTSDEYFGRISYGVALGRSGKGEVAVGYGHLADKYYLGVLSDAPRSMRDVMTQNLAQALARYEYNTLSSPVVPVSGAYYRATAMGVIGQHYYSPAGVDDEDKTRTGRRWWQIEFTARNYWDLSKHFAIGTEIDILASNRRLLSTYSQTVCDAPAFTPSASFSNVFTSGFRANSYGAIGVIPIWKLGSMFQLRGNFDMFMPLRPIRENKTDHTAYYGDYLSNVEFFGQLEAVMTLPFANVSAYTHYSTVPGGKWNFGLTFGLFLQAPKFLR